MGPWGRKNVLVAVEGQEQPSPAIRVRGRRPLRRCAGWPLPAGRSTRALRRLIPSGRPCGWPSRRTRVRGAGGRAVPGTRSMDWMLTAGRRRGGKPGTGLSGRTVRLTLGRLSAALEMAVLEGKLVRNVARLVKPPEHTPRERETGARPRSRSFSSRLRATGCTRPGACRSTACGAVKSSAYAGRTST